jgi:hypothetical protein
MTRLTASVLVEVVTPHRVMKSHQQHHRDDEKSLCAQWKSQRKVFIFFLL